MSVVCQTIARHQRVGQNPTRERPWTHRDWARTRHPEKVKEGQPSLRVDNPTTPQEPIWGYQDVLELWTAASNGNAIALLQGPNASEAVSTLVRVRAATATTRATEASEAPVEISLQHQRKGEPHLKQAISGPHLQLSRFEHPQASKDDS